MGAVAIPPHVIQTVLQYILPPSLPLPPHLLSKRLTERHHFLTIAPTDSASYLCWPSADAAEVAEALEHGVPDTLVSKPNHQVRYTAPDEETVLAHVRPDAQSPIQIVFAWDVETETWRYHDARMLPFPEGALLSLDAAPKLASEWPPVIVDQPSQGSRSTSPTPDDYWAGYEPSGSSPDTDALPLSKSTEEDDKAEAAYWASYAAVHGSGDSTIPSPKFEKCALAREQNLPEARNPETAPDPFVVQLHLRLQKENAVLSSPLSSQQHDSHTMKFEETSFSKETRKPVYKPLSMGTGELVQDEDVGFPQDDRLKASASEQLREKDEPTARSCREDRETGLREAIKGIYRLWKVQSGSEDAASFINIVKDTLEI